MGVVEVCDAEFPQTSLDLARQEAFAATARADQAEKDAESAKNAGGADALAAKQKLADLEAMLAQAEEKLKTTLEQLSLTEKDLAAKKAEVEKLAKQNEELEKKWKDGQDELGRVQRKLKEMEVRRCSSLLLLDGTSREIFSQTTRKSRRVVHQSSHHANDKTCVLEEDLKIPPPQHQ